MVLMKVSVPLAIVGALYGVGVGALTEQQVLNRTYDYVIVGGGTSGLTVANRLTASGKRKFTCVGIKVSASRIVC